MTYQPPNSPPDLEELRQALEHALELAGRLPRPDPETIATLDDLIEHLTFLEALARAEADGRLDEHLDALEAGAIIFDRKAMTVDEADDPDA